MFFSSKSKKSNAAARDTESHGKARAGGEHSESSRGDVNVQALLAANEQLKAAVKMAEAEHIKALQSAVALKAAVKESEEQLATLRIGFISLDEKHTTLQEETWAQQTERQESHLQIRKMKDDNETLALHAQELKEELEELRAKQRDSCGTNTSNADSDVREAGRAFGNGGGAAQLSNDMLSKMTGEAEELRVENERLKADRDSMQQNNTELDKELASVRTMSSAKDAELEASAAVAYEVSMSKQRVEADLIMAREEKKLMEQVIF